MMKRSFLAAAVCVSALFAACSEKMETEEALLAEQYHRCIRIPMRAEARSLNLSNSVAIVLYEALRQQQFAGLMGEGHLHPTDAGDGWRDYLGPKQGK